MFEAHSISASVPKISSGAKKISKQIHINSAVNKPVNIKKKTLYFDDILGNNVIRDVKKKDIICNIEKEEEIVAEKKSIFRKILDFIMIFNFFNLMNIFVVYACVLYLKASLPMIFIAWKLKLYYVLFGVIAVVDYFIFELDHMKVGIGLLLLYMLLISCEVYRYVKDKQHRAIMDEIQKLLPQVANRSMEMNMGIIVPAILIRLIPAIGMLLIPVSIIFIKGILFIAFLKGICLMFIQPFHAFIRLMSRLGFFLKSK
jgi:hypothetical protein